LGKDETAACVKLGLSHTGWRFLIKKYIEYLDVELNLHIFMAWCLVKQRDNLAFTLPYLKGQKTTGRWKQSHNEELHNLYSSPNVRMVKSRRKG
jgi:hypothetical protein